MFSEVLPCVFPGKFKAVASTSGVVEMNDTAKASLAYCDKAFEGNSDAINVINIHGTSD